MPANRIAALLTLMSALVCGSSGPYPENPFLMSDDPTAQDAIVLNASAGPRDSLQYPFPPLKLRAKANQISVQLKGVHVDAPIWCVFGWRIDQVSIGTFPPGSYTATVNWRFTAFPYPGDIVLGVLPLTIVDAPGAGPVSLPASSRSSLAALVLTLFATAFVKMRRRPVALG